MADFPLIPALFFLRCSSFFRTDESLAPFPFYFQGLGMFFPVFGNNIPTA